MALFTNLPAITEYLTWAVKDAVEGAQVGFSNVSCSAYVRCGDREVRFSDHSDRYNDDEMTVRSTVRVDDRAEEVMDDDGDFGGYEVADWWLAETIADAVAALSVVEMA